VPCLDDVIARQHVAACIASDGGGQPAGFRVGADEDEQAAAFVTLHVAARGIANVDRRDMRVAVRGDDLRLQPDRDVRLLADLVDQIA